MKRTLLAGIVWMSLCVFSLTSCDDDKKSPISLKDYDGNELSLVFPDSQSHTYELQGGEGEYSAKSGDEKIVKAEITAKGELSLQAVAPGETTVTVSDEADNELKLKVTVAHFSQDLVIGKLDVEIKGELTDDEKKEIEKEALETILVKVDGGYKFIYTDEKRTEGVVNVYPEKFGDKVRLGEFRIVPEATELTTQVSRVVYELTLDKEVRMLVLEISKATRADITTSVTRVLLEDLTEDFKADYEGVEEVVTLQTEASEKK